MPPMYWAAVSSVNMSDAEAIMPPSLQVAAFVGMCANQVVLKP
jgi:hypothetical protein